MKRQRDKIKLYGLRISYYTGKMEGYLSYKEIPHDFVVLNPERVRLLRVKTGAAQMPAVELADGRFMTDTTPMTMDLWEISDCLGTGLRTR